MLSFEHPSTALLTSKWKRKGFWTSNNAIFLYDGEAAQVEVIVMLFDASCVGLPLSIDVMNGLNAKWLYWAVW
jgi:hypothetical protein